MDPDQADLKDTSQVLFIDGKIYQIKITVSD